MELEQAMDTIMQSPAYRDALQDLLVNYAGRETPLTFCPHLSEKLGFRLWLKREDLLHTGAHKINNALGQALLARMMGKTRLIAETGAGQHGVATATAAARLKMDCTVFMGAEDVERQSMNVMRMKLLGAEVVPVDSGSRTLKDAINAALRYWISHQADTLYCFGTAAGPHPFPTLVRQLQSVIGREARAQMLERAGRLPDVVVACVGGGSNAIGMLYPFVEDEDVRLVGVEAGGTGEPGCYNSAPINLGSPGVLHGHVTRLLQDEDGQIQPSHSISRRAGLSRRGPGTFPSGGNRPRALRSRLRRFRPECLPGAHEGGRYHSGAGIFPCRGVGAGPRGRIAQRGRRVGQPLWPRRQGPGNR